MNKNDAERRSHLRQTLKNHFTPATALLSSEFGLLRHSEFNITKSDAENILREAAKLTLPSEFLTVGDTLVREEKRHRWLSSGCANLDAFLKGGFALRGITEIAGSSGCGKTQLCLQLLLTVQLAEDYGGLKAGAVYICTEDAFPSQRLQQLIQAFSKVNTHTQPHFGDNVFIEHIADVDQLQQCLADRLPRLLSQRKVGLVVIDSIAGVFRGSYNLENCLQRAETLRSVGRMLHLLAHKHDICVICINQVTANMKNTNFSMQSVPSLGLAWANLVTTRLLMTRTDPSSNIVVRTLEVLFSPYLPNNRINFIVEEDGVKGV